MQVQVSSQTRCMRMSCMCLNVYIPFSLAMRMSKPMLHETWNIQSPKKIDTLGAKTIDH